MGKRATASIRIDESLVLRPAGPSVLEDLREAFEETWPDVSRAMPWIKQDDGLSDQISLFLEEKPKNALE